MHTYIHRDKFRLMCGLHLRLLRECVRNMSLGYVGVQVWSSETVHGHGEGQVETGCADGLGG